MTKAELIERVAKESGNSNKVRRFYGNDRYNDSSNRS